MIDLIYDIKLLIYYIVRPTNIFNISIFDVNILMYCIGRPTASSPGFFEMQISVLIQEGEIKIDIVLHAKRTLIL